MERKKDFIVAISFFCNYDVYFADKFGVLVKIRNKTTNLLIFHTWKGVWRELIIVLYRIQGHLEVGRANFTIHSYNQELGGSG